MRAAFFDLIGGASGNMLFGAFVDAGADFDEIVKMLNDDSVEGWSIVRQRTQRRGVAATYIDVVIPGEDHHAEAHRHPPDAAPSRKLSKSSSARSFRKAKRALATTIAERLARADADLRFHPIGQIDAIIDIAATCIALDLLGIERCFCSDVSYRTHAARRSKW